MDAYVEAFGTVLSSKQTRIWSSYLSNDVLELLILTYENLKICIPILQIIPTTYFT